MLSRQICSTAKLASIPSRGHARFRHTYQTPEITLSQLEDHLIKSAVYENGLLIVNKPVGVSFERGLAGADTLSTAKPVCLKSALPALQSHFNITQLFNVKIPERHISGVTIFSDTESLVKDISKWSQALKSKKIISNQYHAIVIGNLHKKEIKFYGSISLQAKNGIKRVVLKEDIIKNRVRQGEEKRLRINVSTLAHSDVASLLQVESSQSKWNCVRAYLAVHCLAPVLGDELYGTYVSTILGQPVLTDVFSKPLLPAQKLPESLKKRLGILGRKDIKVPLHLHLSSVTVMRDKRQVSEYSMPHPPVFRWTMEQLGLSLGDDVPSKLLQSASC